MKLPKEVFGINTKKAYEKFSNRHENIEQETDPEESQQESKNFSLEDKTNFYKINGIPYKNGIYTIDLSREFLQSKTQDQHAQHKIENPDDFSIEDISLYHAMFNTLHQNKNSQYKDVVEEVRNFIKQTMNQRWLTTLTRIRYNPDGKDIIIHDYKQSDKSQINIDTFVGPDGYITKSKTTNITKPLQSLFNTTQSVNEINQVYKWLNDVDSYIWRLNSRPENIDERVARLDAGSDWADLNCSGGPSSSYDGLGVRKKIFHKK